VSLSFLTPFGALVALAALLPVAVWLTRERRARAVRRSLRLDEPTRGGVVGVGVALAALPVLLGIAAAQPVLDTTRTRPERTDAELLVVVDTSRSMLASASPGSATRYARATAVARDLATSFRTVPLGLASITDRVLPHVFPTSDSRVFLSALQESIGIERPPPAYFYTTQATTLGELQVVPTRSFFSPTAKKRVLIVLTDGETRETGPRFARAFQRTPHVQTFFARFWHREERIYESGIAEAAYKPDPKVAAGLDRAAEKIDARVFEEDETGELVSAAKAYLGDGPTRPREREGEKLALMPFATALAGLPLLVVLRRRNL
jgi:von Willebrand factor type A domain